MRRSPFFAVYALGASLLLPLLFAVSAHAQGGAAKPMQAKPMPAKPPAGAKPHYHEEPTVDFRGATPPSVKVAKPAPSDPAYQRAVAQVDGITQNVIDAVWDATDVYWHEGDYYRIVALIRVIVEADPTFDEGYSDAAWLLWSVNDTQGADYLLDYAVSRSPNRGVHYFDMGWHLFNTKRYADALPYLQKAVAMGDVPVIAYTTLGHCYTQLGKYDDAVTAWQMVVKKFPDFVAGPKNLKQAQDRAANRRS